MRFVAVIFGVFWALGSMVFARDIEVVIGGKSYYSMKDYRAAQRGLVAAQTPQSEKIDPVTEQAVNELKSVSLEQGISRVRTDFDQNWDNPTPKFHVEEENLEKQLEAVADNRKEPVLVVSENGKLRVMLLEENKTSTTPEK